MPQALRYLKHLAYVAVGGFILGAAAAYFPGARFVWVAAFGAMIGASELVARYRDAPERALGTLAGIFYMAINASASMAALRLMEIFGWLSEGTEMQLVTTRVLVAGFGAMAFFRSALFMRRVGDQDLLIGPINFLQTILTAIDRAVDRVRGDSLSRRAMTLMAGVDFDKAVLTLVPFCADAMQNMTAEDEDALVKESEDILNRKIDPNAKAMLLGIALMKIVGEGVVDSAVTALGPIIRNAAAISIDPPKLGLNVGADQKLKGQAIDSAGTVIERKVLVWTSSDKTISIVDALGKVTGVGAGTAAVTATADGVAATIPVVVS